MDLVCDKDTCAACGACMAACPTKAISIKEDVFSNDAVIDKEKCIECGICVQKCPQLSEVNFHDSIKWYQGWSKDSNIRKHSTSGGVARTLSENFVRNGGAVCSCVFTSGRIKFIVTDDISEIKKMSGSKYVKSNLGDCYSLVLDKLKHNIPVLFIGLPCQAEGMRKFVSPKYSDLLYTIDLICHGTPSRKFLEMFLEENGIDISLLQDIKFRYSESINKRDYKFIEHLGVMDYYSVAFLNSLSYTDNCYECKYAHSKRASDITLGDSWGSDLSNEVHKGISLILCQTEKGDRLVKQSNIDLYPVDLERAIKYNPQLQHKCAMPKSRIDFVNDVLAGKGINRSVFRHLRYKCLKQFVKKMFIYLRIVKPGGYTIGYKSID
jgi:coenzyme F420-reducing hydrogenase beta subunit